MMKNGKRPDPGKLHPIPGYENEIYVKPAVRNPHIVVGDFTYIADSDFESHVTHLYEWNGDRLIIGSFCQISNGTSAPGPGWKKNSAEYFILSGCHSNGKAAVIM